MSFYASALLAANVETLLYENTSTLPITVNVRAANDNSSSIRYWVAIGSGAGPEGKNCITPNVKVPGYWPWEDTGQRLAPGEKVWVKANKGNVSVRVFGVGE